MKSFNITSRERLTPCSIQCGDCKYRTFAYVNLTNLRGCSKCGGKLEVLAKGVEVEK